MSGNNIECLEPVRVCACPVCPPVCLCTHLNEQLGSNVCPLLVVSGVEVAHLCRNSGQCLDAGNTHYCRCQAGYTGSYCQDQVDECSPNPCHNGATCTDYLGGYSCEVGGAYGAFSTHTQTIILYVLELGSGFYVSYSCASRAHHTL